MRTARLAAVAMSVVLLCACGPVEPTKIAERANEDADQTGNCDPSAIFPTVTGSAFRGVLVPKEYLEDTVSSIGGAAKLFGFEIDGFWTPTSQSILQAENRVRATMSAAATDLTVLSQPIADERLMLHEIKKIVEDLNSYDGQYAGIVVKGHRYVLCNFVKRDTRSAQFLRDTRRCSWTNVTDAKLSVNWRIRYEPESDTCSRLE